MPTRSERLTELVAAVDEISDLLDAARDDALTLIDVLTNRTGAALTDEYQGAKQDLLVQCGDIIAAITKLLPMIHEHCEWIDPTPGRAS